MAVTTTNLGVITAYGDAVAAGYTGTKAEWQALMASYATVGQQAVDAKNAAVAAKDTAVSKATEATTAANTATTKASEASASAQSIAQSASQIAQNTSDISELKEDTTQLKIDLGAATVAIEQGYWAIASGTATSSGYWCRSKDYIPKDISIKALNDVLMYPLAYDKLTGTYIGTWNGSEFSTTYVQTAYILDFTAINWVEKYPDYVFKLDFYRRNGPAVNPSYVAQNVSISSILTDISVLNDRTLSAFASVKAVNHRGYNTIAPENTLPAFEMSSKLGYKYVETDVAFTSDDVPVLMHDASINRTARNDDGTQLSNTVNIADITYEQALTYDYGIWKGAQWAGTKIPTFEEFMYCCKAYNLHPWIELKQVDTAEQVALLISIIKKYGMEEHVSFISFLYDALALVKTQWDSVELGYNGTVSNANNLKTGKNRVFMIFDRTSSASTYEGAISAGYQLCFYAPNTVAQLTAIQTDAYDSILTDALLPVQIADAVKGKYDETNA